ncbi:electron transfer flavoprotein subunit beta/FixA family protein [Aneurinibacillus danicus]|jgi:electron transfer flavoprotein beta subunit|uniref:Electron transfer flavoprotein alpha/beta-subunit N-terminal domain-containing protein n=1 Tax=Aneurinibacillus danicus TaxID=267746 RepID=A0A511V3P6_9BACL|nr:hypothetical protein [Aneurinibacillus danicus]GEN33547.1 hypothetical protein ADA01nite_10070 [Aneurinibacillus danicus]
MQIAVCLKLIPDMDVPEVVNAATGMLDEDFIINRMDPGSIAALEMALRFKNKYDAFLTVIMIAPEDADYYLKEVKALGAERVCRIWHENLEMTDTHGKALVLSSFLQEINPAVVFFGSCSGDTGNRQLPAFVAEMLDMPQVTGVAADIKYTGNHLIAFRRLEKGAREKIKVQIPAVISVGMESSGMPYASLNHYVEALAYQIEEIPLHELGIAEDEISSWNVRTRLVSITPPSPVPQAIFTPDSNLDPLDRIRAIVSGGLEQKKGMMIEGDAEKLAEEAFQFLKGKGFV